MTQRRSPTTAKVAGMILVHKNDPNAHHVPGGANIKSGIVSALGGTNYITFNTPFASIPRVVLTVQDTIILRDCLYKVTAVSATGFTFEADVAALYAWIATDAGDP